MKIKGLKSHPDEQQKIAMFLGAVDERIAQVTRKKALLEDYKKGCMQQHFSQKIRFKDDQGNAFQDWEEKRLGDVAQFSKGKGVSKADISEDGATPCIRYGEIYTHYREHITEVRSATNATGLFLSKARDVIIPASGEDPLDMARACCVEDAGVALGGDINVLRGAKNGVFLAYYLNNAKRKDIARYAQGNSVVHLYATQMRNLILTLPHPDEQRKIAGFLGAVDERIAQVTRKKALLEDYKKGCMQQLFSQKIRFKDDQGNDFPDWEEKRLGDVASINPKSDKLPDNFLYIDLESVSQGRLTSPKPETPATAPSRAQRLLARQDILFQLVRPYQRNNYYFDDDRQHVASTGYAQLRAKESSAFLYQAVHESRFVKRVLERCTGTNYPAINSNDLAKVALHLPHPDEQQKIAGFLSAIDTKIDLVGQELGHAQSFKKGLLQQMFV